MEPVTLRPDWGDEKLKESWPVSAVLAYWVCWLVSVVARLQAERDQLQKRVQTLETRLKQNSSNSSRPPSSNSPYQKSAHSSPQTDSPSDPSATSSNEAPPPKKRGGQVGHPGQGPRLLTATQNMILSPCILKLCFVIR